MIWDYVLALFRRARLEPVTGHDQPGMVGLEVDAEGWLAGPGVKLYPSVRNSRLTTTSPIGIVWHYTATDHGTAHRMAKRIRTYKRGKDRAASWHVCVAADGTLYQSVSFLRGAWHCRRGSIGGHRINACTVGIELEGHGDFYPEAQLDGAARLIQALRDAYPISRENAQLGHADFDPERRSDPGELWQKRILPGLVTLSSGVS